MSRRTKPNMILKLAFVCVVGFLVVSVINLQTTLNDLRADLAENQAKVTALEDDITELNIKLSTPISVEYIERVAREQLGYRMPGEIIFYNDIAE